MDCPSSFEIIGMWFFPDTPEKKYLGKVEYNPFEKKHILTLYGIALEIEKNVACINGETIDGKNVSLFDSSVSYWNSGGNNTLSTFTIISFQSLLLGNTFFPAKAKVGFHSLSFQFSNLAE